MLPKTMVHRNVVSGVVVIMCGQFALGHAEEPKPVVVSKNPSTAPATAAAPVKPPSGAPATVAPSPKTPKKPRKVSASEQARLTKLAKEARAFAELLDAEATATNFQAGANTLTNGEPPPTGGLGSGWAGAHATKCCGADESGGAVGGVGTGVGYSGYGPRDRAPLNGSVQLSVRGLGEPLPATAAIRSRIAARMAAVKRCAQVSGATVASKTTVEFAIDETGRVVVVKANGNNQVVVDCVAKLAPAWRLPAPKTNTAPTRFEVTFTSTP